MKIKHLANNVLNFIINRVIEILGLCVLIIGFLLLVSLVSFSPDDPNFIFPKNTEIKNLLGFRGSFIADLFFQSFGLIAFLIPLSLICTGINIIYNKRLFKDKKLLRVFKQQELALAGSCCFFLEQLFEFETALIFLHFISKSLPIFELFTL